MRLSGAASHGRCGHFHALLTCYTLLLVINSTNSPYKTTKGMKMTLPPMVRLEAAFQGDAQVGLCTVTQTFGWSSHRAVKSCPRPLFVWCGESRTQDTGRTRVTSLPAARLERVRLQEEAEHGLQVQLDLAARTRL
jgi:hypothetical protein